MKKIVCGLVAIAASLMLMGAGAPAVAAPVASEGDFSAAAACYDTQKWFVKKYGTTHMPSGDGYWKKTNNCNDINLRLTSGGAYVKAITAGTTKPAPGARPWCPTTVSSFTWVPNRTWKVVEAGVPTGTHFYLCFRISTTVNGYAAY